MDLCEYFDKFPNKTLKHPLPQSLVHIINYDIQRKNATYMLIKINVEILKEKYKKISLLLQQLTYEINDKIYFLQEPKKSTSAVALLQNQL